MTYVDPTAAPPAADPSGAVATPAAPPVPAVGALVAHTYFDPYSDAAPGGVEVTVRGIVVAHETVVDADTHTARDMVHVFWLRDVSGPIPPEELH
jgi:hypothetical protein